MTDLVTSEAERLLYALADEGEPDLWDKRVGLIEAHDAEVRRATVERIRAAVYKTDPTFQVTAGELSAILDEEAAR